MNSKNGFLICPLIIALRGLKSDLKLTEEEVILADHLKLYTLPVTIRVLYSFFEGHGYSDFKSFRRAVCSHLASGTADLALFDLKTILTNVSNQINKKVVLFVDEAFSYASYSPMLQNFLSSVCDLQDDAPISVIFTSVDLGTFEEIACLRQSPLYVFPLKPIATSQYLELIPVDLLRCKLVKPYHAHNSSPTYDDESILKLFAKAFFSLSGGYPRIIELIRRHFNPKGLNNYGTFNESVSNIWSKTKCTYPNIPAASAILAILAVKLPSFTCVSVRDATSNAADASERVEIISEFHVLALQEHANLKKPAYGIIDKNYDVLYKYDLLPLDNLLSRSLIFYDGNPDHVMDYYKFTPALPPLFLMQFVLAPDKKPVSPWRQMLSHFSPWRQSLSQYVNLALGLNPKVVSHNLTPVHNGNSVAFEKMSIEYEILIRHVRREAEQHIPKYLLPNYRSMRIDEIFGVTYDLYSAWLKTAKFDWTEPLVPTHATSLPNRSDDIQNISGRMFIMPEGFEGFEVAYVLVSDESSGRRPLLALEQHKLPEIKDAYEKILRQAAMRGWEKDEVVIVFKSINNLKDHSIDHKHSPACNIVNLSGVKLREYMGPTMWGMLQLNECIARIE